MERSCEAKLSGGLSALWLIIRGQFYKGEIYSFIIWSANVRAGRGYGAKLGRELEFLAANRRGSFI